MFAVALAVVLLGGAAVQWALDSARDEAIDNTLDNVPGLQADPTVAPATSVAPPADAQPVEVVDVIDGDTIAVAGDAGPVLTEAGRTTVRLLEIDTPEVDGPNTTEGCFGPEASAYTTQVIPVGSTVLLARDEELTDRFGRTLAYVWTEDGTFVNESILRNGFGYATLVAPNDQHISVMIAAEDSARSDRRGLWGLC